MRLQKSVRSGSGPCSGSVSVSCIDVELHLDPAIEIPVHAQGQHAIAVAEDHVGARAGRRGSVVGGAAVERQPFDPGGDFHSAECRPGRADRFVASSPFDFLSPVIAQVPLRYQPLAAERRQVRVLDAVSPAFVSRLGCTPLHRERPRPPPRSRIRCAGAGPARSSRREEPSPRSTVCPRIPEQPSRTSPRCPGDADLEILDVGLRAIGMAVAEMRPAIVWPAVDALRRARSRVAAVVVEPAQLVPDEPVARLARAP